MISIVCVYNNKKILENCLLKSLDHLNSEFELITLDNTEGVFKSGAEALNCGGKRANNKYIMFVHQDVDLSSKNWLTETEKWLDSIPHLGIAGVAGMSEIGNSNAERGRNVITNGNPPEIWHGGNPIHKPELMQTLDECLIIIPKSIFNILQFDEKTCDDWHLYAVDYCLSIKRYAYDAYVIPMFIYHKSAGASFSETYYTTLKKILKKHRKTHNFIYTTMGDWNVYYPLSIQKLYRRILCFKNQLKNGVNKND